MAKDTIKIDDKTGMPTAAQIKEWKTKHGDLHKITVGEDDDKPLVAIVREPKLRDLKLANMAGKTKSDLDMLQSLYNNCVLFEDPDIRKFESNYMAAFKEMGEVISIKEAKVEKL